MMKTSRVLAASLMNSCFRRAFNLFGDSRPADSPQREWRSLRVLTPAWVTALFTTALSILPHKPLTGLRQFCVAMVKLVLSGGQDRLDVLLKKIPSRGQWMQPEAWSGLVPGLGTLLRAGIFFLGFLLIAGSMAKPWWDLPCAASGNARGPEAITAVAAPCQNLFKALLGSGLCLFLFLRWYQRKWSMACVFVGCSMIMVGLIFPYFVMFGSPEMAADAAWLQMQHDNLTWLGGDINTAAESGLSAWKSKNIWVDIPRQIVVAPLPRWSVWDVQLDKLQDVLIWTGYSQIFCQFVRKGWGMGMMGAVLLTSLTLLYPRQLDLRRTGLAIVYLTVLSMLGIALALYSPFSAKQHLEQATAAMRNGDYERALYQLELCRSKYPTLSEETNYIRQRGLIEYRLGLTTEHALLWSATQEERAGFSQRAFDKWRRLCDSGLPAIRREALRAVQRFATEDYNSGRIALSRERLQLVLQRQPANVKAIYFLQIIAIREKNIDETYRLCDWMYAVTEHLNFATVKVLRAVSQQHALVAAAQSGDPASIWDRIRGAKKP